MYSKWCCGGSTLTYGQVTIYLQNMYVMDSICLIIWEGEISFCLCNLPVMQTAAWFHAYPMIKMFSKMFSFSAVFVERIFWVGKRFGFQFSPSHQDLHNFLDFLLRIRCSIPYSPTQVQSQKVKGDLSADMGLF